MQCLLAAAVAASTLFALPVGGAQRQVTSSGYQSEWESARQSGLLTRCVSGYDGAQSNHRYLAVWRE